MWIFVVLFVVLLTKTHTYKLYDIVQVSICVHEIMNSVETRAHGIYLCFTMPNTNNLFHSFLLIYLHNE